jgi:hypothetical protein
MARKTKLQEMEELGLSIGFDYCSGFRYTRKFKELEDEVMNTTYANNWICVCGQLATGLHESRCSKLRNKVERAVITLAKEHAKSEVA